MDRTFDSSGLGSVELNPFDALGIEPGASEQEVRAAYRRLVKHCHPDQFQDQERQSAAQEKLIRLNLAYEAALKLATRQPMGFQQTTPEGAKHFARRLMEQGNLEGALRQLARADRKDADWFCLQGEILMKLKQYETAHRSFREAVRREPDNKTFRQAALEAAVEMKKHRSLGQRLQGLFKR